MTREESIKTINEILKNNYLSIGECRLFEYEKEAMKMAVEALEQPEIIRCTDCKYAAKQGNVNWCDKLMCYGVDDWYCASARRKEE